MRKMIFLAVAGLSFILCQTSFGQANQTRTARPDAVFDTQFGIVSQTSRQPIETSGTEYLEADWLRTVVYLKPSVYSAITLPEIDAKLDLLTDVVEINTTFGIKVIEPMKIDSFTWVKPGSHREKFISINNLYNDGKKERGFGKVLVEGQVKLLEISHARLKQSYNETFAVGDPARRIVISSKLYIQREDVLHNCTKKNILTVLHEREAELKSYIKSNQLNLHETADLINLIQYYNTL